MPILVNNWEKIWNKRTFDFDVLKTNDDEKIFKELKRANGFDVVNDGLSYLSLIGQHNEIKANFAEAFEDKDFSRIKSIYEVGCGSGGNLYLFNKAGLKVGGCDYSHPLTEAARKALKSDDILCASADKILETPVYDVVLSNSVFSYFPDSDYANRVLEIMYNKCRFAIGLIDIHDADKKEAFIKYRRATVEDYENRYKNLPKFFYDKKFFIDFAQKHNMRIVFKNSNVEGYWNNDFIFNCYMYKK